MRVSHHTFLVFSILDIIKKCIMSNTLQYLANMSHKQGVSLYNFIETYFLLLQLELILPSECKCSIEADSCSKLCTN